MSFIGIFETPSVRLNRLRTQFDSTSQSMGDTVTDAVDLEARRRAMEDNLRRFREVEAQQQPPAFQPEPVRQQGIPSLVSDVFRQAGRVAGGPEDAFLPENVGGLAPPIPTQLLGDRQRQMELFRRLIAEGVGEEEAAQRAFGGNETFTRGETATPEGQLRLSQGLDLRPQDITAPGTTQDVVGQLPFGVQELEQAREQFTAPIAALGLQVGESPIGSAIPGVAGLKALQESGALSEAGRVLGEADIGQRFSPARVALETAGAVAPIVEDTLPRGRTFEETGQFVNPFKAFTGDEEEQERALAVIEEAGFTRGLAAELLFDPLNVLPGVGFSKIDDVARLLRLATRATGAGRVRAITTLKNSIDDALRGIREAPEAGARPLRGGQQEAAPGFVRLYRGQRSPRQPVPLEPPFGETERGRAFSTRKEVAESFGPSIDFVDVPEATFAKLQAEEAALFKEFPDINRIEGSLLLPAELANQAKPLRAVPASPLRGGELPGDSIADFDVGVNPHTAKADPGPPPQGPPRKPPTGPSPDDAEFGDIQRVAIRGEQPDEALMRRHQGAIDTAKVEVQAEVVVGNKLLKEADLGKPFRGTRVPKTEGEFDELNSLLHNSSAVESGERAVPDNLRSIYDQLRAQTDFEQAARVDFDPEVALIEDYFFRGWKPPEGLFTGSTRGQLGRNPSFKMPRVDPTYDEMRGLGFEPLFNNPVEQARFSREMGVKYREQSDLIEALKTRELAQPHDGGPIPKGWRVPRVGSAFEGKPYAIVDNAGNPRTMFTRRFVTPDSLANRLESAYGVTPDLSTVTAFGKTAELIKVIDALVFIPKRAKLIASVFQHVDFATRSFVGAWAGFVNALRHGQPVAAVGHLAKWPDSALTMLRATTRPGFRQNLRRLRLDKTPLFKDRDLSMRMISEAGLSTQDVTILPELDAVAREAAQGSRVKAVVGQVADLERLNRQGLFQGMYPGAILPDVKNNIAPMMLRNHPDASDLELAGMIAKAANTKYSTVQAATSIVQNRFMRNFLTRLFFSMGEQEGLIRAFTGAIRGPNAAFWREHWVGAYIGLIGAANVIHFASTGEPLPLNRFSPISKDKFGPLPFGYNRDFAAPDIPFTGRSGTELTIDLVGQLDTAFRLLDPASYLTSRTSVPVRAGLNQLQGKDFFGAPIDTVGPEGVVSRAAQLASDLFTPIGFGQSALQLARNNIEGAEGVIQPGEDRLGTAGTLVQATGLNLRAETTPQLINRTRDDVMRELKITGAYEDLDPAPREKVNVEVEKRIGQELELRRDVTQIRGQVSSFGQQIQAQAGAGLRVETETLAPAARGLLNGDPSALDAYNKARTEFFTSRRAVGESEAARLGIEPREREARTEQQSLVNAYYALEPDPGPNGFVDREDMDRFFTAQDKVFAKMDDETKEFIRQVSKVFTDPDVIAVEEMRVDAIAALKEITALPKWVGLTVEEGDKVDDLVTRITADVQRFKAQATREGLDPDAVTFRSTAEWLEGRDEITELDALNAIAISSGKAIRDQGRIDLALDNRRVLLTIFPNFLDSVLPVGVERQELTEQEIGQLEPAGVGR